MNERYSLDVYNANEGQVDSEQPGRELEIVNQSPTGISEPEEIEWDILPSDPVKSAEGDIGHERNTSVPEEEVIDIDVVVEEPTDTQAGAQSAENDRQEISRLRQELDIAAGSGVETGIVTASIEDSATNTTDVKDGPNSNTGIDSYLGQGDLEPQIIDIESSVESTKGPGQLAKVKERISRGFRILVNKILPTRMTPESARATLNQARQVEGEYAFWVSEANKASSRIMEIESTLRMNPNLKKQYDEELRSLKRKQEEIRLDQAKRQKILFPLRDKAIHAKRMVDGELNQTAREEEVRQKEEEVNKNAERLQREMFSATDWVDKWNKRFGAVFRLNLDKMVEVEKERGGDVNISHLNGIDFEEALWEQYQRRSTVSVKINRAQFKNMVGQVFVDLAGTGK